MMATYVKIQKVKEDSASADYEVGPNEGVVGILRISKETGEMDILREVPGDDTKSYSIRANRKLVLHFREGEFPDVTCVAS